MGAMPSPAQSKLYAGLLPVELSLEALAARAADLTNDQSPNRQPSLAKQASRAIARFLIAFYIGVVTTLAWQSYSDAARQFIARLSPRLAWLAPQAAVAQADTIDQIARSVDRIVAASQEQTTRSVNQLAASQDQLTRSVGQLAANQEQVAREIIKLQAISQYGPYKNSEPPPRPAPAPARNAVQRTSQAP